MSDLYRKTYRGYLIDHHSPDPPIVTLEKISVEEYERFFREANINNLMLYCKDHWGVTYYDTKVGKRHGGLKEDWIAKLRPVLRRLGIEFNAYYSLEYDCYAPEAHPEWSSRKPDGTPLILTDRLPKWGMPCYETGYRKYVLEQLLEIVSGYEPDSLFMDIFGKSLCYCNKCRDKFEKHFGYPLPEDEETLIAKHKDIDAFLNRCEKEMLKEITDTVKGVDPELKVTINFSALYVKEIRDMLDYQFTEPWAGNWLSAAYSRDTAREQYPQLGSGELSEVYNYRPQSAYISAASQIAAQGCRVFIYSGSQHTDGTLEHEESRRVGAAYRELEKFERYLDNREVISDIGIIQSDAASLINNGASVVVNSIVRVKQGSKHRDALLGAMKLCDYSKYSWNVVPEQELTIEKAKKYKVLMLPEVYFIDERLRRVIEGYVDSGGVLISAGETGLYGSDGNKTGNYSLSDIYGCDFIETIDRYASSAWGGYLEQTDDIIWKHVPDTFVPVSEKRAKVKSVGGKPLAFFVDPAVELTENTWVNWWCPPPASGTGEPAILENTFGAGKVFFAAFDMFGMENKGFNLNKDLFRGLLEKSVKKPAIRLETELLNTLAFVAYNRLQEDELIVHEVSKMAENANGDTPLLDGGALIISSELRDLKSAELVYPVKQSLEIIKNGNTQRIRLPELRIHQVIRLT